MQFSHPVSDQPQSGTPTRQETAPEELFREPEYAPGTPRPEAVEPTPVPARRPKPRPRRTDRRRTAA